MLHYLRIRVGAALATVYDVEMLERETQLAGKNLGLAPQISLRKGCELVKQWLDYGLSAERLDSRMIRSALNVG